MNDDARPREATRGILNRFRPDPSSLRVAILSCPKTGNTWLRWLIHHAYGLPMVEFPRVWSDQNAAALPPRFVTHQHLQPSESLVRWALKQNVHVLTPIRHPADTLYSYFHHAHWADMSADPAAALMKEDGEIPGERTLEFAQYAFVEAYSRSLMWLRLGAIPVRYESLCEDPVQALLALCSRIVPIDAQTAKAAVLMSRPEHVTRLGGVDPRHVRSPVPESVGARLPPRVEEALMRIETFQRTSTLFGYRWGDERTRPAPFEYAAIDPFRGRGFFDNGEKIVPKLREIFLTQPREVAAQWPDPTVTGGNSFWNWLRAPSPEAVHSPGHAPATLTNMMVAIYRNRPDVQAAYPEPLGTSRIAFMEWFLGRGPAEYELPMGLMSELKDAYLDYLTTVASP